MDTREIDRILNETFADYRLTRSERRAVTEVFAAKELDQQDLAMVRARAFKVARTVMSEPREFSALDWLEDVIKALHAAEITQQAPAAATISEALFSPGDAPRLRISTLMQRAQHSIDVCVFTVTDDRITTSIESAHRRGVRVRVITDNDKAFDRGSDVDRLGRKGIPVRVDRTDAHMHHKFCVFDGVTLVTGSYNWTRSAASKNSENIVITDDGTLVQQFKTEFDRMWNALG